MPKLKNAKIEKLNQNTVFEINRKSLIHHCNEASHVYILSRQKLIWYANNGPIFQSFGNKKLAVKQCYQTGH